jgi:N6-adenosine-specific RNA methylase IME4
MEQLSLEWITDLTSLVTAGRTFGTIYLDPSWPYEDQATRGATAPHYQPMSLEDIAALPVKQLAAPESQCHLWITSAFLQHGGTLLTDWGFTPKSQMIWDKGRMGMGNLWRVQHEILWTGVRGEQQKRFRRKDLPSVYRCHTDKYTHRGPHSRKPDEVRMLIEQASYGPYLELFGREMAEGWTVYGNELISLIPIATSQPRCAFCGEIFTRKRRSRKYCDGDCRQRAHRAGVTITADHSGG